MIGLGETWLKPNTFLPLNEASPSTPTITTPMLLGPLNWGEVLL